LIVAVSASYVFVTDDRGFPWLLGGVVVVGICAVWTGLRDKKWLLSLLMLAAVPVVFVLGASYADVRADWFLRRELPTYEIVARQCLATNRDGPCHVPALDSIDCKGASVERGAFWLYPKHHHVFVVYAPGLAGKELVEEEPCAQPFQGDWYLVSRC
jgi:hypothetical protein